MGKHSKPEAENSDDDCQSCGGTGQCADGCCDCPDC
jgi:hypothetical protein